MTPRCGEARPSVAIERLHGTLHRAARTAKRVAADEVTYRLAPGLSLHAWAVFFRKLRRLRRGERPPAA